jgi:hypothetical protein
VAQAAEEAPRLDDAAQPPLARLAGAQRALDRAVKAVAPLRSR